ncbi:MAG: Do family serine endopeptidase [Bacteroidetes bacterium]|nr:Do family serine endopeptidase [Bacteroidota bacterium]
MKRFGFYFFVAVLGGIVALGLNSLFLGSRNNADLNFLSGSASDDYHARLSHYVSNLPSGLPDFVLVSEMTVNSVVHIRTEYEQKGNLFDDFYNNPFREFFFGPQRPRTPQRTVVATGSGVIISGDGYIVTNNHVVQDADKIEVTLNDNSIYDAIIIGTDPTTDLALIKVNVEGLPFLAFGDSDEVRVGEWVLAVGNPFNLTSTVTAGIVSAKGRNINILGGGTAIESFIQTDAALNRGNSGGALVNSRGELIGINAAIASQTGSFAGYSFAIPSNIAKKVSEDLIQFGEVQRGFLGIEVSELNSKIAQELGLSIFRGAYVQSVREKSAAYEAGIKPGDVVIGMDNQRINTPSELIEFSGRKRPGEKVIIKYHRDGKTFETTAVMRNIHGDLEIVQKGEKDLIQKIGADFEPASKSELERLNIKHGVRISAIRQGRLRNAGIREGFIITHIDRKPVKTSRDVTNLLGEAKGGILVEGIYPNGNRFYYGVNMN